MINATDDWYPRNMSLKYPEEKRSFYMILILLILSVILIIELPIHYYKILRWLQSILLMMCSGIFLRPRLIGYILHPRVDSDEAKSVSLGCVKKLSDSWTKFIRVSPSTDQHTILPTKQYEILPDCDEYKNKKVVSVELDETSSKIRGIEFSPLSYNLSCVIACFAAIVNPTIGVRMSSLSWVYLHILIIMVLLYSLNLLFSRERKNPRFCLMTAKENASKDYYLASSPSDESKFFIIELWAKYWPAFIVFYSSLALIVFSLHKNTVIYSDYSSIIFVRSLLFIPFITCLIVYVSQICWYFTFITNRWPTLFIYGTVVFCLLFAHEIQFKFNGEEADRGYNKWEELDDYGRDR